MQPNKRQINKLHVPREDKHLCRCGFEISLMLATVLQSAHLTVLHRTHLTAMKISVTTLSLTCAHCCPSNAKPSALHPCVGDELQEGVSTRGQHLPRQVLAASSLQQRRPVAGPVEDGQTVRSAPGTRHGQQQLEILSTVVVFISPFSSTVYTRSKDTAITHTRVDT